LIQNWTFSDGCSNFAVMKIECMRNSALKFQKIIQLCLGLMVVAAITYAVPEKDLTLGVLAFRPKPEEQAKWQPLADYLSKAMRGRKVRLEVLNYPELEEALVRNGLDFVLTNPGHYIQMRRKNGLSGPLATLIEAGGGKSTEYLGGVVFARQDRNDIRGLSDLKGKSIAVVSTGSLGGYQAQALELLHEGIRLPRDSQVMPTGMPHDLVVYAVLQGKADAGFVRTGVLEAMAREDLADMSSLKVLARRDVPAFPYAVSTPLYPEWPFIAMPHVDDQVSRKAAAALLDLEHDGVVARSCRIHGFAIPADYSPVENLLLELRLPPFDKSPQFTVRDVWQKYRFALIVLMISVLIISLLTLWLVISKHELQKALAEIKTLHGILPICASCRKIRDEVGAWHQLETYISRHTDAQFSHGICKECAQKLYPQFYKPDDPAKS
jgi:ABC-type phosphate/phosphonate transport system substrate-binding protein